MTGAGSPAGRESGRGLRIAILVSRFNSKVTERLLAGARRELERSGVASGLDSGAVTVEWVPGAFELPLAAQATAENSEVDAVVALGCVIRGDTDHYRYVCDAAARGLLDAGLKTGVPVAFGVLTTDTDEQALARSGEALDGENCNKGAEAVRVAIEMSRLLRRLAKT